MKITITDGNLPANVSIFIEPNGTGEPTKKLMVGGQTYEIPDCSDMRAAVEKRQMEGEAVHLAQWESKLGRLNVYGREYAAAHAAWMLSRFSFEDRWGKNDTTVYNETVLRA